MGAGLPDCIFSNKNPNFYIFLKALAQKSLVNPMSIWYILWPFGIFFSSFGICGDPSVYFPVLVCCREKSGNPVLEFLFLFFSVKMSEFQNVRFSTRSASFRHASRGRGRRFGDQGRMRYNLQAIKSVKASKLQATSYPSL
jgi:hypothetical protein